MSKPCSLFNLNKNLQQAIVYKKTDMCYIEWQRVITSGTTSDIEWQRVVQRATMRGTTRDSEWQQMRTSDNEWLRVTTSGHFVLIFLFLEEQHYGGSRRKTIELKAEASTVRSSNWDSFFVCDTYNFQSFWR